MGNGIATNQLMQMVAGAVNPGLPVANLYVRLFSLYAQLLLILPPSSRCGVMML